jgi:hypothetical protein
VCQWQAAPFDLGAPGSATAFNAGRWAGDSRRASSRRYAAEPVPLPLSSGTWRHRTPPRGKGSPDPSSPVEGAWPVMVRLSHVAAGPPGGSGAAGATRKPSCPPWCTGAPGFPELGEGPETVAPAVRPGSHATSPSGRGGGYGLRDARGLDTLAGGTPVCMYRHSPFEH